MRRTIACLIAMSLACSAPMTSGEAKSSNRERLEQLQRKIVALIDVPRAEKAAQCRTIAFGSKPCGGPWRYLVYSTNVTEREQLEKLVAEYNALEKKINAEEGIASDCMFVGDPGARLVDGICKLR